MLWHFAANKDVYIHCTLPCKVMRVKIVKKNCNFTILLAKPRGLRQNNFISALNTSFVHIVTLFIKKYERTKRSPLALTHAV